MLLKIPEITRIYKKKTVFLKKKKDKSFGEKLMAHR
jgi:hypothetical protein